MSNTGITIIEPVSSRFTKVSTLVDNNLVANIEGEEYVKKLPPVKRFPGSKQGPRPQFNGKLGMFKIVKEDGTLWTQTDLDNLVQEVPITYASYNCGGDKSKIGQLIPKANIKDVNDAYLASWEWKIQLGEGTRTFKDTTWKEKFLADMLRGNRSVGIENSEGIQAGDVEYIIKRPALEKERKIKRRDQTMTATDLYRAMFTDRVRLVGILRLFNIDVNPDSLISDLQDAVWEKADDDVTTQAGNSYQKLFVHYATTEDFRTRELISLGSMRGFLKTKGGMYYFDEVPVGSTYEEMIEYFKNPNNSSRLDALKLMLGEK